MSRWRIPTWRKNAPPEQVAEDWRLVGLLFAIVVLSFILFAGH